MKICLTGGYKLIVGVTSATTLILQFVIIYNFANTRTHRSIESKRSRDDQIARAGLRETTTMIERVESFPKKRTTFGIPTVKRPSENYFQKMFRGMVNKTTEEQRKEIIFVVFLADLNNSEWKNSMKNDLLANYSYLVKTDSLLVIQAPESFYADLTNTNDSYLYWRTKQNYDYAYLMTYCRHLSEFYVQMEDDVIPSDNYYSAIMGYVENQSDDNWVCLEFSKLGFIGKMYHSRDLMGLSAMFLIFNSSQPVDYIYVYFNILSGRRSALRKPTLFQHLGYHSSLDKKIQPLQDDFFNMPPKKWKGDNPPSKIYTSLEQSTDFPANMAYSLDVGFFWSIGPAKINDTFTIVFETPQRMSRVVIETGNKDHARDNLQNGCLEFSSHYSDTGENLNCDNFKKLDDFEGGHLFIDSDKMNSVVHNASVNCLRIRVLESQNEWLIISEIAVFINKET
ncbi:alpha-1,3-mannosyl-glycoprotein 4-beta-N-acetylglucosaminyltransferase C-like [Mya arenaria]|uniref:alpha-1,3-mannosyl-glycoprotein 4-beta-N-acetylglucosaminyltransferase C-like n=1 Tax=Mya arenaria TaxID=6604 RepID=UPI0022E8A99B|nr:alpha-1,3-mannosyl-glycoprotein 4-beta-N-acetylglucosaminyltransferase C-like [Mya arenaria]XP_052802068.1 alpha-1,3-mannosyl-glycoprotein 4-beta-N-acetylglucosaminyltransferase C-like [Mya arenaria]XP_052802069.1 alpha-1,3-mannosyl-glycoprotein 4-beta-N-acetylglucosaminyltransferase C-like [Mya arenaria]XP_052802070.1 alpha-1,3-mannosyl-glycoprotein 4-beta-N-acetylglucosaminyltransferase C-like [Mya arenaria]